MKTELSPTQHPDNLFSETLSHCCFALDPPSEQILLDIFEGEWWSKLPPPFAELSAGTWPAFDDSRIHWAMSALGGVTRKNVLELGPLEGGHTYMLENNGASRITCVESNIRAYLKCLIIKEIFCLTRSHFLLGDIRSFLETRSEKFDVCIASGVLYHQADPLACLGLMTQSTDHLYLFTHYYTDQMLERSPVLAVRFTDRKQVSFQGFECSIRRQEYLPRAKKSLRFCGGNGLYSHWMYRDDIISALKHFGMNEIKIHYDQTDDIPTISLLASRTSREKLLMTNEPT